MEGPIRSVGVVGSGTMGSGIAQLALEAGHEVHLHDVEPAAIEMGRGRIRRGLVRRAASLELDADAIDDWVGGRLERLHDTATLIGVARQSDLVIEAALEDLATKRALFAALDAAARPETVLATNTSALSVAAIAGVTARPRRVAGLHFFNPAPLMRLVEVVRAPATDPDVIDRLVELMAHWGRTPVRCADSPGFIVNRVNRAFTLEPLAALEADEATVEAIDEAARLAGYPMGPFELMDLIGLDVNLAVTTALHRAAHAAGDPLADRFRPSELQARLVAAGRLGRKHGGGFRDSDVRAAGGAAARAEDAASGPMATAVIERTSLAIVNEAYRTVDDGVAREADIDVAVRSGVGHPIGPFERAVGLGGPSEVLRYLGSLAGRGPRFAPAAGLRDTPPPS